jgi:hypothetical protein
MTMQPCSSRSSPEHEPAARAQVARHHLQAPGAHQVLELVLAHRRAQRSDEPPLDRSLLVRVPAHAAVPRVAREVVVAAQVEVAAVVAERADDVGEREAEAHLAELGLRAKLAHVEQLEQLAPQHRHLVGHARVERQQVAYGARERERCAAQLLCRAFQGSVRPQWFPLPVGTKIEGVNTVP